MQSISRAMRIILLIVLFLGGLPLCYGQLGGLAGAVTDAITGRELVGVSVSLKPGGRQDLSDVEGRFLFNNLEPGIYSLELRETNHKVTYIPIIRISADELAVLRITMYDSVKTLSGVVITTRKPKKENNAGVASERKSSPSIMDGISQEAIKRTPDRNTAEVLRRISGIAIQDNKYPVIRGLNDRYNYALLNGIPMPSSMPDRKAFSFDLIPSGLIDNLLVVKSGMPDRPGEITGALILVNMRDIPDETVQTVSLGFGGYTNSLGKKGMWQTNKGADALGFGIGGRSLPGGMPGPGNYMTNLEWYERAEFSKKFENDWAPKSKTMLPALQFQYSNSSRFRFAGKETGSLLALSYSRLQQYNSIGREEFNKNGSTRKFDEDKYTDNVLLGGMLNFSMKLNKRNKITWRNFLTNNSNEENSIRTGTNYESQTYQKSYALNYIQNLYYGTQLSGEHFMSGSGIKINWDGALQEVQRNAPDARRLLYTRPSADPSQPLMSAVGTRSFENAGKMYSNLNESVKFASYSVVKSYYTDNYKVDIKAGGWHQSKNRDFDARIFSVVDNTMNTPLSLKVLAVNEIFKPENMGGDGFRYDEIDNPSYSYTGKQTLHAGYLMLDNIIDRFFRITGGLRVEKFTQQMSTFRTNGEKITPTIDDVNLLPSLALTILANNKTNIRFSYAKTATRPDFREISPFNYFDFVNFVSVVGNDTLRSGTVNNYDFRFETFPGDGQSFSVGLFMKDFKDPVEQSVSPVINDGNRTITFQNAKSALVYGLELEFRYKLKKVMYTLRNFELSGNFAYTFSEAKIITPDSGNTFRTITRPLQGQSPYLVNTGLNYVGRKKGWAMSLNYNLIGPRIYSAGTVNYPDFYETSRNVVDLQIAKSVGSRSEFKLTVGDILAQDYVLYQNTDNNTRYSEKDRTVNRIKTAPLLLFSYTYRIK